MKIPSLHYSQAENIIKDGDILLCAGNMWFSKLIRFATKSEWTHVAFILRADKINEIMVFESVESIGVRTVPLSNYVSNYNGTGKPYDGKLMILRHKNLQYAHIERMSKKAVRLLGHNYSWSEIARTAYRIFINRKKDKCDISDGDNEFICSEYAYECFNSVGLTIPTSCGYITPGDFAKSEFIYPVCRLLV